MRENGVVLPRVVCCAKSDCTKRARNLPRRCEALSNTIVYRKTTPGAGVVLAPVWRRRPPRQKMQNTHMT